MRAARSPRPQSSPLRRCRAAGRDRPGAAARRHAADRQGAARQQRRQPVSRDPRLGAAHDARRGRGAARTAWPSTGTAGRCGRSTAARPGTTPGCLGTKANPVHHFDESGKEIRSFGGGHVRVAARHPRRSRRQRVGGRRRRRRAPRTLKKFPGEGNKGSVVVKFSPEGKVLMTLGKPGVRGNPPEALTDPTDVVTDPRQRRRLRRREPHRRGRSQPGRSHLGVRPERQVPAHDRQDRHRAGRVPDAARARVRLAGPADRRRSPQPPHPDPDQGGQVRRRVRRVRPDQRAGDRPERRDLHRRLGIRPSACIPAGSAASASAASRTAR